MSRISLSNLLKGDKWILLLPVALSIFGLVMIFDSSALVAARDFSDKFHFVKLQATWLALGISAMIFFAFYDYRKLKKFSLFFVFLTIIFLLIVLIPGIGRIVYGGRRWIQVGQFVFQPAELAKISLLIYFSALFERKKELFPFIFISGLVLLLLLLEPDMGTAIIMMGTFFSVYFASGVKWKQFLALVGSMIFLLPFLIIISPYRRQRLLTFINSSFDISKGSYHLRQVIIALGSGGFFGRGLGQSRQKFLFLPEVTTDSIFAIIAEELGFSGAGFLVLIFIFWIVRCLRLTAGVKDDFGRLLCTGLVCMVGLQALINLGSMVLLLPLTGVPLPFISYGGSSLVVNLSAVGMLYNISRLGSQVGSRTVFRQHENSFLRRTS